MIKLIRQQNKNWIRESPQKTPFLGQTAKTTVIYKSVFFGGFHKPEEDSKGASKQLEQNAHFPHRFE